MIVLLFQIFELILNKEMKMKTYKVVLSVMGVLLFFPLSGLAQSSEDPSLQLNVGLKAWDSSILSYFATTTLAYNQLGKPVEVEALNTMESSKKWELLPSFSVRYGSYFVSATYNRTKNDLVSNFNTVATTDANILTSRTDRINRSEIDINLGYSIAPGTALVVGYKGGNEKRNTVVGVAPEAPFTSVDGKINALIVGLVSSYKVADNWGVYAQLAVGKGKFKYAFAELNGTTPEYKDSADYLISELGINYSLSPNSVFSRSSIGIGYRSQTVKTQSLFPLNGEVRGVRNTRDGFVLSMNVGF